MSSFTSLKSEEEADDFIDSSSFWMELSTSSMSETPVSFFVADKLFVEMPSASPVYLGSVNSPHRGF
jgi:hypothetical protein